MYDVTVSYIPTHMCDLVRVLFYLVCMHLSVVNRLGVTSISLAHCAW